MCEFFYGGLAQLARARHLQCRGHRFDPDILHHKIMEQWQMWSLQRTENPKELDRNQPAPPKLSCDNVTNLDLACKGNRRNRGKNDSYDS